MSELPRTDDLPRPDDGLDPGRIEAAFSSFAERVRELESVASELRSELQALRAERDFEPIGDTHGGEDWPVDGTFSRLPGAPSSGAMAPDWVASVPPPVLRPLAAPRVALEGVFLLAVALLAGLARLEPVWIVLVMTAAWALVAFSEWTAATKRTRWRLDEVAPSVASEGDQSAESTGPWSMPVVEATAVEQSPDSESHTVIATLPEEPEPEQPKDEQPRDEQPRDEQPAKPDGGPEPDEPAELPEADELPQPDEQDPQPARRGLRLWRRRPAATGVPDPWEQ